LNSILESKDYQDENLICLTENELIDCMMTSIETCEVKSVEVVNNHSKLEKGDYGYSINEKSKFIINIAKLSIELISEIEYIQSNYM